LIQYWIKPQQAFPHDHLIFAIDVLTDDEFNHPTVERIALVCSAATRWPFAELYL